MLTVLACVRTTDAARTIAVCARRLGVSPAVRTATSAVDTLSRLAEHAADLVFVDGTVIRADPVAFVNRALAYAPRATLVMYGLAEPTMASAVIGAGARGVIRGGDSDLVTAVTKTVLLLGATQGVEMGVPLRQANVAQRNGDTDASDAVSAGSADVAGTALVGEIGTPLRQPAGGNAAHVGGDARNSGPGFDQGRSGSARRGARHQPAVDDASSQPATLVPQQRMDLRRANAGRRAIELTERELQVLRGMAEGKSNAEIGRDLFVSEDTVKTHARRLFRKLGARDRAHAVASGFRMGLVG